MGKYSNFDDPVGLLWRMIRSGNRAAYGALIRAATSLGVSPLDWVLKAQEKRRLTTTHDLTAKHPLVLIVGPPRSGSSLLYQTLARYADVSYITNFTDLFSRSPITATNLLPGQPWQSDRAMRSYYCQTVGLRSPNDGFEIWNRWLGVNRYEPPEELEVDTANEMRRFFVTWTSTFDKPFLNKNNRNAYCITLLARTLSQAKFVIIRRDPRMVTQSLIQARVRVQGSKHKGWGLASSETHARAGESLGYVDDICDQLIAIETRLNQQLATLDNSRYVETTYEDFCKEPVTVLREIASQFGGIRLNENLIRDELKPFSASSDLRLSSQEQERVERRFANT